MENSNSHWNIGIHLRAIWSFLVHFLNSSCESILDSDKSYDEVGVATEGVRQNVDPGKDSLSSVLLGWCPLSPSNEGLYGFWSALVEAVALGVDLMALHCRITLVTCCWWLNFFLLSCNISLSGDKSWIFKSKSLATSVINCRQMNWISYLWCNIACDTA